MNLVEFRSRQDFEAKWIGITIVWAVVALLSPCWLWCAGMHMGFGGATTLPHFLWHGGHLWEWDQTIGPKYNPTTAWPLIDGYCFILVPGSALLGLSYKVTDILRRGVLT